MCIKTCASEHFTLSLSFLIIGLIYAFEKLVNNKNNISPHVLYKRRQLHQVPIASNEQDTDLDLHNLAESNIYPEITPKHPRFLCNHDLILPPASF